MQKSLMGMAFVAISVIAATAVTTARSRSSLRADRVSSTEQSLVREAAPFNRLVHNRADALKLELSRLAATHSTGERSPSIESDSFDGLAWIEPGTTSDEFTTKWVSQGSDIDSSWLQNLPLRNLHDGDAIFIRHGNGESATEGLLITAESFAPGATIVEGQGHRVILFGTLNANAFAGLVDDWVGSSRTAQIFDEKGVVLAHTNRRSVGAQLKEEGVVRAMSSGKRTSVSGVFDDSEGRPLVAQAERIPQTNLRVSLSVSQRLLDQAIAGTVQSVFWFSLFGFSLLAAFAYWVYLRLLAQPPRHRAIAGDDDEDIGQWSEIPRAPVVMASVPVGPDEMPASLRSLEVPRGLAARIAEAKGEKIESMLPPLVISEPSIVLTFEDIEVKAKQNVKDILDRSAAIRARLNLDFVEDFTTAPAADEELFIEPFIKADFKNDEEPVIEKPTAQAEAVDTGAEVAPSKGFVRKPKIKAQTEPKL